MERDSGKQTLDGSGVPSGTRLSNTYSENRNEKGRRPSKWVNGIIIIIN